MWEVITYGGGEYYRDVFLSVAMMAGTNGFGSLIRLALVIGVVMMILKMATDLNPGQVLKWFIIATVMYGILWVPKAQVHITDKFDVALTGADVANVPLGIAAVASISSRVGNRAIELTELTFSDPSDVRYSRTGMVFGAKVFERLRTAQIADPLFDQNLRSFFRNCVYYDLAQNYYSMGELSRQNDLWTYLTVTKPTNPGRSGPFYNATGAVAIVSCPEMVAALNSQWTQTTSTAMQLFERGARPTLNEAQLQTAFQSELGSLHPIMVGQSRDAASTFRQVLMINTMRRAAAGAGAEAGANGVSPLAETQSELQTRNTQFMLGAVAEKAVVILKIVTELLFIGMFPILFPAFLLPRIGPKLLQGYFVGFLYLQLWGPMYVILHKIMMGQAAVRTAAASYIPGAQNGIKLANLEAIGSVNADIVAVSGVMVMMIPVLAAMMTKGAMAVGSQGEALLGQFRSGAEAAGATATTGNLSLASTSLDNHSFHNTSGNRIQTSAFSDTQQATRVLANGTTITEGAGGTMIVQTARSNTAANILTSESISAAHAEAAGQKFEESKQVGAALEAGTTRAVAQGRDEVTTWFNNAQNSTTTGSERRASSTVAERSLDQASARFSQDHNVTLAEAQNHVAAAALSLLGGVKGGGAGLDGKLGATNSYTNSIAQQDQLSNGIAALSTTEFSNAIDRNAANYTAEAYTATSGTNHSTSERLSNTLTSTEGWREYKQSTESEAKYHEDRADYVQSHKQDASLEYNNAFAPWAMNRLVNSKDAYGTNIDENRAAQILSGHTGEDINTLRGLTKEFIDQTVSSPAIPDRILQNREVAQTVRDFDGLDLRVIPGENSQDVTRSTPGQTSGSGEPAPIQSAPSRSPSRSPSRAESPRASAAPAGQEPTESLARPPMPGRENLGLSSHINRTQIQNQTARAEANVRGQDLVDINELNPLRRITNVARGGRERLEQAGSAQENGGQKRDQQNHGGD